MPETTIHRAKLPAVGIEAAAAASQRFEMRMSPQLMNGLEIMAAKESMGKADIVRRALGLYALALEAESKGQLIGFANSYNNETPPQVTKFIKLHSTIEPSGYDKNHNNNSSSDKSPFAYERFEMRISSQLAECLNAMANTEGIGKADIVRRALGLYALALEAESKGQAIMFANLDKGNKIEVARLIMLR